MKRCAIFLAAFVFMLIASSTRAEPVFAESIEWMIADSDWVVTGRIVKVERVGAHEAVTVDVEKTYRGRHDANATFIIPYRSGWAEKRKLPMLFCLVKRENVTNLDDLPAELKWVTRPLLGGGNSVAFLGSDERHLATPIFTLDFKVLTEPRAVQNHIETYAKSIPPEWKKSKLMLSVPVNSQVAEHIWGRSGSHLYLPADPAMEKQARAWCTDKSVDLRSRGACVLGIYKNEENIKILKSMLQDMEFVIVGSSQLISDRIIRREFKQYIVRASAYRALRELGIDAEMPVTEVTLKEMVEFLKKN